MRQPSQRAFIRSDALCHMYPLVQGGESEHATYLPPRLFAHWQWLLSRVPMRSSRDGLDQLQSLRRHHWRFQRKTATFGFYRGMPVVFGVSACELDRSCAVWSAVTYSSAMRPGEVGQRDVERSYSTRSGAQGRRRRSGRRYRPAGVRPPSSQWARRRAFGSACGCAARSARAG